MGDIIGWIQLVVAIGGLGVGAVALWKKVKKALKEQQEFLEELSKFTNKVTLALADKQVSNKEIETIMKAVTSLHKEGKEVIEAYQEAGAELSELIVKAKNKIKKK